MPKLTEAKIAELRALCDPHINPSWEPWLRERISDLLSDLEDARRERDAIVAALHLERDEDEEGLYSLPAEPEPINQLTLSESVVKAIELCENDANKAERALAEARQGWIPVSERLPDKEVDCLVAYNHVETPDGFDLAQLNCDDKWVFKSDPYGVLMDYFVTHWRPLPAPPETTKEEKP